MYESYYGLTEKPFSIQPDPEYLYLSKRHTDIQKVNNNNT